MEGASKGHQNSWRMRCPTRLLHPKPNPSLEAHSSTASTSSFCFWELAKDSSALRACRRGIPPESQSKPDTKMVDQNHVKNLEGGYQLLFMAGIAPYQPSLTRVLIVAHLFNHGKGWLVHLEL